MGKFKQTEFCHNCGMAVAFSLEDDDGDVKHWRMKEHPVEHCLIHLRCEVQTYKAVLATAHEVRDRIIGDYERLRLEYRQLRDRYDGGPPSCQSQVVPKVVP